MKVPALYPFARKAVTITLAFLVSHLTYAQPLPITNGLETTCSGTFYDSGIGGNYSDNEQFIFTICPDMPGDVIQIDFGVFDLGAGDQLEIFNGDDITAPSFGTYDNTSPASFAVSATSGNATGCLTFQFSSDASNNAVGWEGLITCFTPCDRPTAVVTMAPASLAKICPDDVISLDASGSFAAAGFNVVDYIWDLGDGTTANGPLQSHSYPDAGEYVVQLQVIDDNGCSSTNEAIAVVWVGTEPTWGGITLEQTICLGETVALDGVVNGTEWSGIPPNLIDGLTWLDDQAGFTYSASIHSSGFPPGATVTSGFDIAELCIIMEHSYLGDLEVVLECPNGTQVSIFNGNGGGGGGTFLGDPIDPGTGTPGVGWEYCFSEIGTFGTLLTENGNGNHTTSTISPGNSMTPGNYTVEGTYNDFIGCDLNGDWTIYVTDHLFADDGYIFEWWLTFDPSLYPSITTFTPSYGAGCDSSYWSGSNIVNSSPDCNSAFVAPNSLGTHDFLWTVTDDFGCTYDTTIQVIVTAGPEVEAGPDQVICVDSLQLEATVVGIPPPPPPCDYELELYDSFGDGWDGASVDIFINGIPTNYTIPTGSQSDYVITVNDGDVIEIFYNSGSFETEHSYALFDANGNSIFSDGPSPGTGVVFSTSANCGPSVPDYVYSWSPTSGLSNPNIADPMVYTNSPTMYYVTVWEVGHMDCAHTDSLAILVDPDLNPGIDTAVVVCANQPVFNLLDMMGGTPDAGGDWTDINGNPVPDTFNPLVDPSQQLTYTVISVNGCIGSAILDIDVLPIGNPLCCAEPDAGLGGISCDLNFTLGATPANGNFGIWSGPAGASFTDPADSAATITVSSGGTYWIYWIEDNAPLCYAVDSVEVTFTDEINPVMSTTDAICFDACDGEAFVTPMGGNAPFTYIWSSGIAGLVDDTAFAICAGTYNVTLSDINNCTDDTSFVIGEPPAMVIDAINTVDETCFNQCDGIVEVVANDATLYSFDGGVTFDPVGALFNQCVGNWDVVVQNADGCLANGTASVNGPPLVDANFSWSPQPALLTYPVVTFNNLSSGASIFHWDFAGLDTSNLNQLSYEFPNNLPNTYEVCLAVSNFNGCADTICHFIEIEDELEVFVPNAFTPNADGTNDWFQPSFSVPVINYELYIFDRWGGIVFSTTNPNEPWYGTFRNELSGDVVQSGVYAWKLKVQDPLTGLKQEQFGHVTVVN